jgi:hypothetical protein
MSRTFGTVMQAFRVDNLIYTPMFNVSEMNCLFITYNMTYKMFEQILQHDKQC